MWPLISPASGAPVSFIFDLIRLWPVFHINGSPPSPAIPSNRTWLSLTSAVGAAPGAAVAGAPAAAEGLAGETLPQPVDIGLADVDLFGFAIALGPLAGGRAASNRLDLCPEHRAPLQQQLEPVVVGGIVAAGDL